MSLAWMYREWAGRRPVVSSDELWRTTLVLPLPGVVSRDPMDGEEYRRAIVLVIAPWWLSRDALDPAKRAYIRHDRERNRATMHIDPKDPRWEAIHERFDRTRPPWPFEETPV